MPWPGCCWAPSSLYSLSQCGTRWEPRLKSKYLIVLVAAAAIVWLVASDLPWPARAFTVLLTTAFPALAIAQVKALRELPSPLPRPQIYISSIISLWLLATIGLVAAVASGYTALLMGLHAPP